MRRSNRHGAAAINLEEIKEAIHDGRRWIALGVVKAALGASSHYETHTDASGNPIDITVDVVLSHSGGESISCRLASGGGGTGGKGSWRIPPAGAEVIIAIPEGELEASPVIIGTLSSGGVPGALDADSYVIVNPKKIHIESETDNVDIVGQLVHLADAAATEAALLATTYRAEQATFNGQLTAVATALTAASADPILSVLCSVAASNLATAGSTLAAAVTTFESFSSQYLSNKVKVGA